MISVSQALNNLFELVAPTAVEYVSLVEADGRTLAENVLAQRDQPPFAASAMDGYAVRKADVKPEAKLKVIGESAAGHAFKGTVNSGEACRIFTGAPLPNGADHVVIQEDTTRIDDHIILADELESNAFVRPAGADFKSGDIFSAPRILSPSDIALLAAMNIPKVPVFKRPTVAIIATGDELVHPGETPGADQIIASNNLGLAALIRRFGGHPRLLPIARDNHESLALVFDLADDADLIVTIGGASVGDHDLVADAAAEKGMEQSFYKVKMRPGKPLMAGKIGNAAMIGLPGNPVSAMVCGHVFLRPVIAKMLGQTPAPVTRRWAALTHDLPKNGPREHYMRAKVDNGALTVFKKQDSALLTVLADANCIAVRPPNDPEKTKDEKIEIIDL